MKTLTNLNRQAELSDILLAISFIAIIYKSILVLI